MIIGIVGDVGAGKTLLMTFFAYIFKCMGYEIYANYHLKIKFTYLNSLADYIQIPKGGKKLLLIDEAWTIADSRKSGTSDNISFSQFILQARKYGMNVIYTVQDRSQLEKRIRINTQSIIEPQIVVFDKEDVPMVMKADFYDKFFKYKATKIYTVTKICAMYDTSEIIGKAQVIDYAKMVEKYKDFHCSETQLASTIFVDGKNDGRTDITKSEARTIAGYIKAGIKPQLGTSSED